MQQTQYQPRPPPKPSTIAAEGSNSGTVQEDLQTNLVLKSTEVSDGNVEIPAAAQPAPFLRRGFLARLKTAAASEHPSGTKIAPCYVQSLPGDLLTDVFSVLDARSLAMAMQVGVRLLQPGHKTC